MVAKTIENDTKAAKGMSNLTKNKSISISMIAVQKYNDFSFKDEIPIKKARVIS